MSATREQTPLDEPVLDGSIHIMSPEEAWERFDRAARHYQQMSGEEFLRAWDSGQFDADPDRPEIMRVVMMRPLGR